MPLFRSRLKERDGEQHNESKRQFLGSYQFPDPLRELIDDKAAATPALQNEGLSPRGFIMEWAEQDAHAVSFRLQRYLWYCRDSCVHVR